MRTLTLTMEINDQEAGNLLNRIATRGAAAVVQDLTAPVEPLAESGLNVPSESGPVMAEVATTEAAPATSGELDDHGVPWNEQFHAKTKTKRADGGWKALRGMDDATKQAAEAYEAQFKAAAPAPAEAAAPVAPPVPTPAPAAPVAAPAAPAIPVAPVAEAAPAPVSFEEVSARFGEVIAQYTQPVLMEKLPAIYETAGTKADGTELQTNETHRAAVMSELNRLFPKG